MEPLQQNQLPKIISPEEENSSHKEINVYPALRTIFIGAFMLLALAVIFFLIYQNGKSLYDNGL